ncbi:MULTISPECIES: beta-ketoacyl-ACP synthase 3 [Spirulina sp. CCY15215]|uniref:beta-ketoacyl-ACP synthase 3 n=1 Tax=Spirulina sp. CCY15215 TaxID=2767591 RepID=UPI0032AF39E4
MKQFRAGIAIAGSGSATPAATLDNHQLSHLVETSDEWIRTRTGIGMRHLASPQETLSQLAAEAGKKAIVMANLAPENIDLIVLATSTPDDLFGSAAKIQSEIGAVSAVAFDLTAACSGFVFGMVTAAQFIRTGVYRHVLLIGADVLSPWVDWSDRASCILFGDGAGAVVMQATEDRDRLLGFSLHSDGHKNNTLNLSFQGENLTLVNGVEVRQGNYQSITMNGREVYRFAVDKVPEVISKALYNAELTTEAIDWLLLHQANQRIMDAVANRLNISREKVISNLAKYGNTSAASIPLALDEAVREGKVKTGDRIAAAGFGAGLTWGAAIFEWGI